MNYCERWKSAIRTGTQYSTDVEIVNDGTAMVADLIAGKVFML